METYDVRAASSCGYASFNGATAFQRWKQLLVDHIRRRFVERSTFLSRLLLNVLGTLRGSTWVGCFASGKLREVQIDDFTT